MESKEQRRSEKLRQRTRQNVEDARKAKVDRKKKWGKKSNPKYPFVDEPNTQLYRLFEREWSWDGSLKELVNPGPTVLILAAGEIRSNKNQSVWCTNERMRMRGGIINPDTITKGVNALDGWRDDVVQIERSAGKATIFHFSLPTVSSENNYRFHKFNVDSGYFQRLKPNDAKVLLLMKGGAEWDKEDYSRLVGCDPPRHFQFRDFWMEREFEIYWGDKMSVVGMSGLSIPTVTGVLGRLEEYRYIKRIITTDSKKVVGWIVYLYPPMLDRDVLRKEINKKHKTHF